MKNITSILLISCRKATELVEKRDIAGLSIGEKMRLHVHTSMCNACTHYQKQSKIIDQLLSHSSGLSIPSDRVEHLIAAIINKNR